MPNPAAGYNDKVRVENEVAALELAREALGPSLGHLIPRVYRWASASSGNGWILQQRMPGEAVFECFQTMEIDEKTTILEQLADVFACLQNFELPTSVDRFGGIGFDQAGAYTSTALSVHNVGPYATYAQLQRGVLESMLKVADQDRWVKGWQDVGIRIRLERFLENRLSVFLEGITGSKRTLVHADLSGSHYVWALTNKY
jgi:hypothetical protein